jgi:uncharacterized RDD family membrane protein YckC
VSEGGGGGPPSYPGQMPSYPPPTGPPSGVRGYESRAGWPPGAYGSPEGAPYATWAVRLGGYLIDAVIFLVVLVVFLLIFRHSNAPDVHLMARKGTKRRNFSAVPFLLSGALWVVYGTVLIGGRRGQTVGMMAAGVRAVGDEDRGDLGYGRAFGRALVEGVLRLINLLFFLLGLVWILDMLFPLWDRKRQTLHDKVVGSVVIRSRPPG